MAKMNKKGFFMSLISVFIVIIFALSSEISTEQAQGQNLISSTETRIAVLNNLVNDLEDRYFERMLYVAGRNALIGLAEYRAYNSPDRELPIECAPCHNTPCPPDKCPEEEWTLENDFRTVVLKGIILDNADSPLIFPKIGDHIPDYKDDCLGLKNYGTGGQDPELCKYFCNDYDEDGVCDHEDNCPRVRNPDQKETNSCGVGDMCLDVCIDDDGDGCPDDFDKDGICDSKDNCDSGPLGDDNFDPYDFDKDGDGIGDVCDDDCKNDPTHSCVDKDIYASLGEILESALPNSIYDSRYSLYALFSELEAQTKILGLRIISLEIEEESLELEQNDAWHVAVKANFKYYFQDSTKVASWKGEKEVTVDIPIEGIVNPYYFTMGEEKEIINQDGWIEHSTLGASFLERLENGPPTQGGSHSICMLNKVYPPSSTTCET
ncbi:thrombospondin type 3 repeat-containing protein [Candidatus Woesearchaeota archaeon]|nr:thrombospondin type 3 repeat-containing protein [Candidatus Woesearchaeota archaeon]